MYKRVTQLKINLDIIKAQQGNTKPQQKSGLRPTQLPKGRKVYVMKKSIVYVSETEAQVTKAFQKNASIFGTEEDHQEHQKESWSQDQSEFDLSEYGEVPGYIAGGWGAADAV